MQRLLESLPQPEAEWLNETGRSILDWGCAFGEGVSLLQASFPSAAVAGLDFSATAIAQARKRYPQARFVLSADGEIDETFDCIITSNCLEHFDDPFEVARAHLRLCRHLYIALVPYDEFPLHEAHRSRFREGHLPSSLGPFSLLHLARIDVDRGLWDGQQLLAIYASPAYLAEQQRPAMLTHQDAAGFARDEEVLWRASHELEKKNAVISARDEAITWLISREKDLSSQIASLQQDQNASRRGKAQLENALRERAAEANRIATELSAERSRQAQLAARLHVRHAEMASLSAELASASARIREIDAAYGDAKQQAEQLAAKSAAMSVELERERTQALRVPELEETARANAVKADQLTLDLKTAQERIAELSAIYAQSKEAAANHSTELTALKQSLSWRLTGPFRRVGEAFPWLEHATRIVAKFVWFTVTLRLPAAVLRTLRRRRDRATISSIGGFEAEWYLAANPDVRRSGIHPLVHYVAYGTTEGRDPNRMFDTVRYLTANPDLDPDRLNPLAHYLKYGAAEGRDPGPQFDTRWYLAANPDVQRAGKNPLIHYLSYGAAEGRAPRPSPVPAVKMPRPTVPLRHSKYDVIILANIDWAARWQRPQQLAQQFARNGHRVFYVVAHPNTADDGGFDTALVADNIYRVRLPGACFFDRYATVIRGTALAATVSEFDRLIAKFDIADAMLHVHLASWSPLALALRDKWLWIVVYDCMDEWDGFPNIGVDLLVAERELVQAADGVTVTGPLLLQKWQAKARRCEVVRNGVDFSFFRDHCRPNSRFSFAAPVIGYYGAVAEWLDLELIATLARRNAQWTFVLAGDVFVSDLCGLDGLPNVQLLGLRPYAEMPELLWHFDVCLIPFKLNDMTHAVDPVKLYEYLSSGKPVVSVPLKEVEVHQDVVTCAAGAHDFARAIGNALADTDPNRADERRARAAGNQWSERYRQTAALIAQACPLISIVVVTFNNCDLTRLCVESILSNTTYPSYEVIVVDNNSSDDTQDYLRGVAKEHSNVRIIFNASNRGFAAANNQGLGVSRGDILLLLNNDVVVPRGWLRGMRRCLGDPTIGLVGPVTNSVGNEARIAVDYQNLDGMDAFARTHMGKHRGVVFDIAILAMYCLAMRRDVFEKIGALDEGFTIGMFEDDDYANRAREAGYRVVCTEESFVHHAGQAAFKKLIETGEYQAVWDRNQAYYESKWGKWTAHKLRGA
jgi:GT2 family glycosyltransferase/glycosyltransferase involved in cell wall biosynthesis